MRSKVVLVAASQSEGRMLREPRTAHLRLVEVTLSTDRPSTAGDAAALSPNASSCSRGHHGARWELDGASGSWGSCRGVAALSEA